ncbi:MAG: J domain-containing protein [Gammaproteobacteria bacterium]|nr:J domain-containing protein [Gammaproteobacteria bacterium]
MKKEYPYTECYQILRIKPDCNWDELRKSYKLQIQKWHPDRYKDKSTEKDAANEKIKKLNIAYQQLFRYFQEHGSLPEIKQDKPPPQINPVKSTLNSEAIYNHKNKDAPISSNKKKGIRSTLFITTFSILTIYFLAEYIPNENTSKQTQKHDSQKRIIINTSETTLTKTTTLKHPKDSALPGKLETHQPLIGSQKGSANSDSLLEKEEKFFSYGSSIGDVINIQGVPDKIEDNIWFYGNSKVHFNNGKVTRWEREVGSPLKANITLNDY